MLIRCKPIRPGGTTITLGTGKDARNYHFKPRDPAREEENHVAEVTHPDDLATLLAIREGYEVFTPEAAPAKPAAAEKPAAPPAPPKPAKAPEQPREQAPEQAPAPVAPIDPATLDKAELLRQVAEKTGKKPHPTTSTKKLLEILAAA